jgi:hypothetical protein
MVNPTGTIEEVAQSLLAKRNPETVETEVQEDQPEHQEIEQEDNLEDDVEFEEGEDDFEDVESSEELDVETDEEVDEEDTEEFEEEQLYTVKINGKDEQVTLEEMQRGYMMEKDYRRKTEEVSLERKALEEEKQRVADLQQKRQEAAKELEILYEVNSKPLYTPQQLDAILTEKGSEAYLKAKAQEENRQANLEKIRQRHTQVTSELTEAEKAEHEKMLEREREALNRVMPELFDESNQKAMTSYLVSQGFTADQVAATADHRYLVMAEKARRFDEMTAKSAKPKSKKIPKVSKKKSPRKDISADSQHLAKLKKRAVQSGKDADMAVYLKAKKQSKRR